MKHLMLAALLTLACTHPPAAAPPPPQKAVRKPVIQLAILLDTSNSMDGLIDQARTQLWRVVNEFGRARKRGEIPELHVALYEYGNTRLAAESGYIRQVLPFTTDLDLVSEELFALQTSGGEEYCGQVIDESVQRLRWSSHADDLRVIFIAGNEPFTQGNVDYRTAVAKATTRGIIVNTIFCGDKREGIRTDWGTGAQLADGRYVAIDQNARVAEIDTPFDAQIATLGTQLNDTYIAYGVEGTKGLQRQYAQDANLSSKKSANVERQIAKSSVNYVNSAWDVVDAKKAGKSIEISDLPPALRSMTPAQREAYIGKIAKERAALQKRIAELDAERRKYIAAQQKDLPAAQNTLDEAIVGAVREAGRKRGFAF
ncbi:MAG TPA: vWA domain-containing protein [Thermoanaerobaculia bacterium]|nr:vWA domain-containing protein [Thermoanaerobaculia bacterium]